MWLDLLEAESSPFPKMLLLFFSKDLSILGLTLIHISLIRSPNDSPGAGDREVHVGGVPLGQLPIRDAPPAHSGEVSRANTA